MAKYSKPTVYGIITMLEHIRFNCNIDEDSVRTFIQIVTDIIDKDPDSEITVHLSTVGGGLDNTAMLVNFIRSTPNLKSVVNTGYINSAGLYFFAAFPKESRIVFPGSTFGFHECAAYTKDRLTPSVLKRLLRDCQKDEARTLSWITEFTDLTKDQFETLCRTETRLEDTEAVAYGIASSISRIENPVRSHDVFKKIK